MCREHHAFFKHTCHRGDELEFKNVECGACQYVTIVNELENEFDRLARLGDGLAAAKNASPTQPAWDAVNPAAVEAKMAAVRGNITKLEKILELLVHAVTSPGPERPFRLAQVANQFEWYCNPAFIKTV